MRTRAASAPSKPASGWSGAHQHARDLPNDRADPPQRCASAPTMRPGRGYPEFLDALRPHLVSEMPNEPPPRLVGAQPTGCARQQDDAPCTAPTWKTFPSTLALTSLWVSLLSAILHSVPVYPRAVNDHSRSRPFTGQDRTRSTDNRDFHLMPQSHRTIPTCLFGDAVLPVGTHMSRQEIIKRAGSKSKPGAGSRLRRRDRGVRSPAPTSKTAPAPVAGGSSPVPLPEHPLRIRLHRHPHQLGPLVVRGHHRGRRKLAGHIRFVVLNRNAAWPGSTNIAAASATTNDWPNTTKPTSAGP